METWSQQEDEHVVGSDERVESFRGKELGNE